MKIIFKILLLFCFFNSLCLAKEVKFIHITDINLNKDNAYKLQNTIEEINSYPDIDFVVFGGNNIENPSFENLNLFSYLLKKVHKKTYVLLGSNDVSTVTGVNKDYYLKTVCRARFFRHKTKTNYIFKKNGYIFVVMDGSKQYFRSSNGYYSKPETDFLEKILKKYKNEKVIILQHFPIIETKSKWLETAKTDDYKIILDKYKNVKVIVSGHYGYDLEKKQQGIYHIITESYSKNNAYKVIQIDLSEDFIGVYSVK